MIAWVPAYSLGDYLPPWMSQLGFLGLWLWQWLGLAVLLAAAVLAGYVLQWIVLGLARLLARRTKAAWDDRMIAILPGPTGVFLALLLFYLALPLLELPPAPAGVVDGIIRVLLIITATWFALRLLTLGADMLQAFLARTVQDPVRLRAIQTQIAIPRGILRFVIVLLGVALVLLQFEVVQSVGVSLIASAGLAGIVLGLAAQRTVANLLAGIQLAFSQPIRIGDAVVVENEFGTVEELTLTYVVIKTWDLRRLIIPVSYFLEKPFQNWTRESTELLGTVFLHADYTVPMEALRAQVEQTLKGTDLWDGKVQNVQVTDLKEQTVEVRIVVSARDRGALWDLRCRVREELLAWLQSQGRSHLLVIRVELQPPNSAPSPS